MRQMRFLLAFFMGFLAASPLSAEPIETVKYEYYEVHGLTAKEIRENMNQHHKRAHGFGNHDANTLSNVNWRGGNPPTVTIVITFQMPKWVDYAKGPRDLQETWQRFEKNLQVHEDGHKQINEECARAVEQRILSEGPKPGRRFKHDVDEIFTLYSRKQIAYDKETQHGRTQGAVFNG